MEFANSAMLKVIALIPMSVIIIYAFNVLDRLTLIALGILQSVKTMFVFSVLGVTALLLKPVTICYIFILLGNTVNYKCANACSAEAPCAVPSICKP